MKHLGVELWKRKALIWNFALSDLKLKYKNSMLGFTWTFLEPLLMLAVLYVVFTNITSSNIEHFGLYLLLGIILWNLLSRGNESSLSSFLIRSNILKQVYFPKEILAISSTLTAFLMTLFELIVFGIFIVIFQFTPTITIVLLIPILILEFILVLGLNFALGVLNVVYRDIKFIWKIVLQAGFFLTPIFYDFNILPQEVQNILKYSPTVQILNMAHDVTLYNKIPSLETIILAILTISIIFVVGYSIHYKIKDRVIEEL